MPRGISFDDLATTNRIGPPVVTLFCLYGSLRPAAAKRPSKMRTSSLLKPRSVPRKDVATEIFRACSALSAYDSDDLRAIQSDCKSLVGHQTRKAIQAGMETSNMPPSSFGHSQTLPVPWPAP
jgi:hypothetical protein